MKQILAKGEFLTVGELEEMLKNIPKDTKIIVYNIGISNFDSWSEDVIGVTFKENENILEFDFSTIL